MARSQPLPRPVSQLLYYVPSERSPPDLAFQTRVFRLKGE